MIKVGKMWMLEGDDFFHNVFSKTGDKFEDDILLSALKYVTDWSLAIDIGAHYGSWTRILAENFECLVKNTEHLNNVELINTAIGDRFDNVSIGFLHGQAGNNSGCKAVIGNGTIPMVTIDSLSLPMFGFIKMDIEGYEVHAINGGMKTILSNKPIIIIEDNKRNEQHGFKVGDTVKLLKKIGCIHKEKLKSANHVFTW